MPRLDATLATLKWLLLAACSAGSADQPASAPSVFHPPPPPGESIRSSTMCSCRACSKVECCGGAAEPGAGEGTSRRCEGYDFGKPGCELSVASCTARCYEEIWRVQGKQSCADKRPAVCCERALD